MVYKVQSGPHPCLILAPTISISTASKQDRRFSVHTLDGDFVPIRNSMAYRHPHVQGSPANTGLDKICTPADGHKHLMYRVKSPYGGMQGLRLPVCSGCGLKDQTDWYECVHCTKKRCHQCRIRPKESSSTTQFLDGAVPNSVPPPQYSRR